MSSPHASFDGSLNCQPVADYDLGTLGMCLGRRHEGGGGRPSDKKKIPMIRDCSEFLVGGGGGTFREKCP